MRCHDALRPRSLRLGVAAEPRRGPGHEGPGPRALRVRPGSRLLRRRGLGPLAPGPPGGPRGDGPVEHREAPGRAGEREPAGGAQGHSRGERERPAGRQPPAATAAGGGAARCGRFSRHPAAGRVGRGQGLRVSPDVPSLATQWTWTAAESAQRAAFYSREIANPNILSTPAEGQCPPTGGGERGD